jgi:DNA-binding transcriptional MerR regulator
LAQLAHVSKRTIDYYTNLGLLEAKRSRSNYRYYAKEALNTLRFIEQCKKMRIPLEEIKGLLKNQLQQNACVYEQVQSISDQIIKLECELTKLKTGLQLMDDCEKEVLFQTLHQHVFPLVQTIKTFSNKGDM